ncbi:MAG: SDR family NAD(P)-dependent oxidoreductase [Deltaproteobacteria bacterium]|nr:SDR family NAD(P)-dependent oxidoreductase [Deltaproteobacteria bacterium]
MARVLILGANSAIAAEVARLCAARGDGLYLVGRDAEKLAALRAELSPSMLGVEAADLADTQNNAGVIDRALFAMGGVDLALVAHGLLGDQEKSEHEWAEAERVLTTNYLSAVSLLIPLANALEAQQSGVLAVITSVAGDRGRPRNYTYGSAKGALNIYLQGVRSRLYRAGARVYAIRLGPVETPMTATHPKNALFAQPRPIAEQLLRAVEGRREDLYLPWFWRPIMAVVRNLPEPLFQRIGFLSGR